MFSSGSSCLPTPSKSTVPTTSVAKLLSICTLYVRTKVKILDKNSPTLICERLCFLTSLNKISISSVNRSVDRKKKGQNFVRKLRSNLNTKELSDLFQKLPFSCCVTFACLARVIISSAPLFPSPATMHLNKALKFSQSAGDSSVMRPTSKNTISKSSSFGVGRTSMFPKQFIMGLIHATSSTRIHIIIKSCQ
jgi:hypothetical protein